VYSDNNVIIDTSYRSSNCDSRIRHVVLHYTEHSLDRTIAIFKDPTRQVSTHYLVPDTAIDGKRVVYQFLQEKERAWHAGASSWGHITNLNFSSIGIENVNLGYKDEGGQRIWHPFSDYQIQTLLELLKPIVDRYHILPVNIVGHSDIAPGRKLDPGPKFPWKTLYEQGVGAWFDEIALELRDREVVDIRKLQTDLKIYGYAIEITGELDAQTRTVLQAFQMHFRPRDYSGAPDVETVAILENLISKYFLQ